MVQIRSNTQSSENPNCLISARCVERLIDAHHVPVRQLGAAPIGTWCALGAEHYALRQIILRFFIITHMISYEHMISY